MNAVTFFHVPLSEGAPQPERQNSASSRWTAGVLTGVGYTNLGLVRTAVSRKFHGAAILDTNLPLNGTPGVECRRGGGASFDTHLLVVTFANNISVGGLSVSSDNGLAAASGSASGNVVTINLTAVANAQTIFVNLINASDGVSTGNVSIPVGILLGDTNGDKFVNSGDALQTRNRAGNLTDATNFRSDVNVDGTINSGDATIVRSRAGTSIP